MVWQVKFELFICSWGGLGYTQRIVHGSAASIDKSLFRGDRLDRSWTMHPVFLNKSHESLLTLMVSEEFPENSRGFLDSSRVLFIFSRDF